MSSPAPSSEVSIGFPETPKSGEIPLGGPVKRKPLPLQPLETKVTTIQNACCLLFYCQIHKRVAIRKYPDKGYFLPNVSFRTCDSWEKVIGYAINSLQNRLPKIETFQLSHEVIDVLRFQLARTGEFYTRLTVLIKILNETEQERQVVHNHRDGMSISTESCISYKSRDRTPLHLPRDDNKPNERCWCNLSLPGGNHVLWMNKEQLNATLSSKFFGPEALLFFCMLGTEVSKFELKKTIFSCTIFNAIHWYKRKHRKSVERKLLTEAKYSVKATMFLFNEYVLHCFPARHMTFLSFKNFLVRMNWRSEESVFQMLFRALNVRESNFLSFHELLLGLAAMDTETPHKEQVLETRLKYIFRFYDADLDSRLNMPEICQLINDIVLKNKDTELVRLSNPEEIANRLNDHFADYFVKSNLDKSIGIDLAQFITISLKNRTFCELTANIFRSPFSILSYILVNFNYQDNRNELSNSVLIRENNYQRPCRSCKQVRFHVAGQAIKTNEVQEIVQLETMLSASKDKYKDAMPAFQGDLIPTSDKLIALDLLNRFRHLGANKFKLSLKKRKEGEDEKNWYFATRTQQIEATKKILTIAKELLATEAKVVLVSSPTYVVSHLHGNFKDLLLTSNLLWRFTPYLTPVPSIVLGNFTDGQPWGIECVLYLICLKILAPARFILVRGIEEIRSTQKNKATFYESCAQFDPSLWEMFNEVFDRLPIGAVVENQIFCSSSGYPQSRQAIDSYKYILANAVLNPLENDSIRQILSLDDEPIDKDGGVAFQRFTSLNQLTHMIRSHSSDVSLSDQYADNQRIISLFSGSKLPDALKIGFALVTRETIRLFTLEATASTTSKAKESKVGGSRLQSVTKRSIKPNVSLNPQNNKN